MDIQSFQAVLNEPNKLGGISYIKIPFNCWEVFKKKGRIKVRGKVNDCEYRISLIPKGKGIYILPLNNGLRKEVGANYGDKVFVVMQLDDISYLNSAEKMLDLKDSKMDVLTVITTRSSIRRFSNKEIDEDTLNTILNSGFYAPSAKNKQPWHFIVIRNKDILIELASTDSNHKMIKGATCCIIISGDKAIEGINEFLIEDCSAAMQNMLLAINGLGLGGVWCGIHIGSNTYKRIIEIARLPKKIIPIGIIAIGYPAEYKEKNNRFDKSKVHYEKW